MPKTWITADHHFGHAKILEHCKRPFRSIAEHDAKLAEAWNDRVGPKDTVWHLGDIFWKLDPEILRCLKGHINLILGNHDQLRAWRFHQRAANGQKVRVFEAPQIVKIDGHLVWLAHYAHRVWPSSHRGSWHLYGHSHGTLMDHPYSLSMDVGVDTRPRDFAPYSMAEIELAMKPKLERIKAIEKMKLESHESRSWAPLP